MLFDLSVCQPIEDSKFHGGGIYGEIVFKKLVQLSSNNIIAYYSPSKFIDPSVLKAIDDYEVQTMDGDCFTIDDAFKQSHADIIYSPLYSVRHNALIKRGTSYVVTIHGLRPLEMLTDRMEPKYCTSFRQWLKAKVKGTKLGDFVYKRYYNQFLLLVNASNVHIITVSNHSKYSIKCYYPQIDINSIDVFFSPSTTVEGYRKYIIESSEKYYLIISANRWLKNAGRAIAAFDLLFDMKPDLCDKVKVLGLKENTTLYKEIRNKNKFELLGYQQQEELEKLYSGAYAFIYPTLNEGFGYPPLEAMKYGTPVVSSPFTSIPEICGDAILYANPYNIEEIANRILQLEDKDMYKKYQEKGIDRYEMIYKRQVQDLERLCRFLLAHS